MPNPPSRQSNPLFKRFERGEWVASAETTQITSARHILEAEGYEFERREMREEGRQGGRAQVWWRAIKRLTEAGEVIDIPVIGVEPYHMSHDDSRWRYRGSNSQKRVSTPRAKNQPRYPEFGTELRVFAIVETEGGDVEIGLRNGRSSWMCKVTKVTEDT